MKQVNYMKEMSWKTFVERKKNDRSGHHSFRGV